jgi:hypothetical protein
VLSNIAFASTDQFKDYTIRVFNGSATCFSDATLRFTNPCYQGSCVQPTNNTAQAVAATCGTNGSINNNASISIANIVNGNRYAYSVGTNYTGGSYDGAAVISSGQISITGLTGSSSATQFVVRIWNGNNSCFKDVSVTVPGVNCSPACTNPTFNITSTPPTCVNGSAQPNATVSISSITNGSKYQICIDQTFTCTPNYAGASAISGSGPLVVYSTLGFDSNQQYRDFTVRVYNGVETCYLDKTLRIYNPCFVCCGLAINSISLTNV